jgi:glutamate-1-semialdehyde 2,1-aminomutase
MLVALNPGAIAAIIVEPVAGNMGVVPATEHFLKGLRALCDREKIVLIFDEVMTGFRVALGGAQGLYDIKPDLTTLGKIVGGGLPVGAFGGRRDIMERLSPSGPVYQAGTLSGNPLAMVAGLTTLKILKDENPYPELDRKSRELAGGFSDNLQHAGISATQTRVGSMLCLFFTSKAVTNFDQATKSDTKMYGRYFHAMLQRGIYLAPSQFEAMFVSTAHSNGDISWTIEAQKQAFESIRD